MTFNTKFLPAERASDEIIKSQAEEIVKNPVVKEILNAVPEAVLILNEQRQIIFVNRATLETLGITDWQDICGLRAGEAFKCSHSQETEGGCGTTEFCRYCGAAKAILSSQQGSAITEECRITRSDSGIAMDLKVKTSPFKSQGQTYTVFSVLDISDEKRRQALQRIFFHDILNTAGGLSGYSELLQDATPDEIDEYKSSIFDLSNRIVDEIKFQRELVAAENGELQIVKKVVKSLDILKSVIEAYKKSSAAAGKKIVFNSEAANASFETGDVLLFRVLGNLVKNALEATEQGGTVKVDCHLENSQVHFTVNNVKPMKDEVKAQIFQRSFSTKGTGRGLGTYSIKLLTEKYLNGTVSFISNEQTGTTFKVSFPLPETK